MAAKHSQSNKIKLICICNKTKQILATSCLNINYTHTEFVFFGIEMPPSRRTDERPSFWMWIEISFRIFLSAQWNSHFHVIFICVHYSEFYFVLSMNFVVHHWHAADLDFNSVTISLKPKKHSSQHTYTNKCQKLTNNNNKSLFFSLFSTYFHIRVCSPSIFVIHTY